MPVEYVDLDGTDLLLPPSSVDHGLMTWTMWTIPDVGGARREIRRVLRAGGGRGLLGCRDDKVRDERSRTFSCMVEGRAANT